MASINNAYIVHDVYFSHKGNGTVIAKTNAVATKNLLTFSPSNVEITGYFLPANFPKQRQMKASKITRENNWIVREKWESEPLWIDNVATSSADSKQNATIIFSQATPVGAARE